MDNYVVMHLGQGDFQSRRERDHLQGLVNEFIEVTGPFRFKRTVDCWRRWRHHRSSRRFTVVNRTLP